MRNLRKLEKSAAARSGIQEADVVSVRRAEVLTRHWTRFQPRPHDETCTRKRKPATALWADSYRRSSRFGNVVMKSKDVFEHGSTPSRIARRESDTDPTETARRSLRATAVVRQDR